MSSDEPEYFEGHRVTGYRAALTKARSIEIKEPPSDFGEVLTLRVDARARAVHYEPHRAVAKDGTIQFTGTMTCRWELEVLAVEVLSLG